MSVSKGTILEHLPPYQDEWILIKERQRVKDIIREMLEAYPEFAPDYDKIGKFFEGRTVMDTCNNLYRFCKENIQYIEEPETAQFSAIPGGILTRGYGDCKAYASFIGGCLGALSRAGRLPADWDYYFASYERDVKTPYHVFVQVVTDDGQVIWVDPTPGADSKMPAHEVVARPQEPEAVGGLFVGPDGGLIGAVATGDPTADAAINATQSFVNSLPEGKLKHLLTQWLTGGFLGKMVKWIGGYKYTGGDYALGEIFLNRVMNKVTYSRWDTPDSIVPIAWEYFTTLFGIPIAVNTDFDNIRNGTLEAYLKGRPEWTGYVTQEQVTRAHNLLMMLKPDDKYGQWPPEAFNLLPYVAPIPDARNRGELYDGTLANGVLVRDGIPATATGAGGGSGLASMWAQYKMPIIAGAAALLLWWWWDNEK